MKTAHARMSSIGRRAWILLGVLPLGVVLVAFAAGSASSAARGAADRHRVHRTGRAFSLKTATGQITTPDGNGVFMWGFTHGFGVVPDAGAGALRERGRHGHGHADEHRGLGARLDRLPGTDGRQRLRRLRRALHAGSELGLRRR